MTLYHHADDRDIGQDFHVFKIPLDQMRLIWPLAVHHLMTGMSVAPELRIDDIVDGLFDESIQLWIVSHRSCVIAAFLTSVENDRGDWVISLYALGGSQARRWLRECDATMQAFARQEGAKRVRMCGRKAWTRLLPKSFAVTGERHGHNVYERAVEASLHGERPERIAP